MEASETRDGFDDGDRLDMDTSGSGWILGLMSTSWKCGSSGGFGQGGEDDEEDGDEVGGSDDGLDGGDGNRLGRCTLAVTESISCV